VFRSSRSHQSKSKRERAKALPWAALLQSVVVIRRHWRSLSEKDRARLAALVRDSHGRWGSLNAKERAELRKLAAKLDLKGVARDMAGLARGGRARRKCRCGARA
jgi:hypothetical protein